MRFFEKAPVKANAIITLGTEMYFSMFIETMNLQNLQKTDAEMEST